MKPAAFTATLVGVALATASGVGATQEHELLTGALQASCTSERQMCLERLARRFPLDGRMHDRSEIERALFELHEKNPECALLLQGTILNGF
ncbi:MAG: hypothetical protein WCE38_23125 [Burkholderiales bacterium]